MSKTYLITAAIMGATFFIHVLAGGPEVAAPVMASDLAAEVRYASYVVWHGVSVVILAMSLALLSLSRSRNPALAVMTAGICLGFALLFITTGAVAFGSLLVMPQWIIFLSIVTLMLLAERLRGRD